MANPLRMADGRQSLAEMMEFARFGAAAQTYIRQALDIGLDRDAHIERWCMDDETAACIRAQKRAYRRLDAIRRALARAEGGLGTVEALMNPLTTVAAFDLAQGKIDNFAGFRFLYERLLGAAVRPWLPSAFCGAAALPLLHPKRRLVLLQSITESIATAPGWSSRDPVFYPEWIDTDDFVMPHANN